MSSVYVNSISQRKNELLPRASIKNKPKMVRQVVSCKLVFFVHRHRNLFLCVFFCLVHVFSFFKLTSTQTLFFVLHVFVCFNSHHCRGFTDQFWRFCFKYVCNHSSLCTYYFVRLFIVCVRSLFVFFCFLELSWAHFHINNYDTY